MDRLAKVLLLAAIAGFPSLSFAWGCSGHEMVALIAERQLNPKAAQAVTDLLKDSKLYDNGAPKRFCEQTQLGLMAFYATWADDYRGDHKETAEWHFWDVPLSATSQPKPADFCDQGCVTKAIEDQLAVLKSPSAAQAEKAQALAFVIHFMGDMHQPLHVISNNDRGGNCIPVAFFGKNPTVTADGKASPNLHGVWDTDLPEKLGRVRVQTHDGDIKDYVDTVMGDFEEQIATWQRSNINIVGWALESHELAVHDSYGKLNRHIEREQPVNVQSCTDDNNIAQRMLALHESVSKKYFAAAGPVIEEQLAKAGTRLAMVLNDVWK